MLKRIFTAVAAVCCLTAQAEINVIPRPAVVQEKEGVCHIAGLDAKNVKWQNDKKVKGAEAYTLSVTPKGIVAKASTDAGLFYARQTLIQLMDKDGNVPCLEIKDSPRFAYRGVLIDPCRHFVSAAEVKKLIDLMAQYKLNRLHWHLTEDQGWRIEIKKYPELVAKGSSRIEADGSVHKGYYSQAEVKDIVAYAAARHVDIVPELELPGHELCAISAYPNLSCRGVQTSPRAVSGVERIVMCPGKEDMFIFLKDVIDEMTELFPGSLFHIGGDECPRDEWKKCPNCQARMKAEGLTKEAQLQSYVIGRVEKYLRGKGKTIIGWDEILEGGNLDTTAVVMSWRGEKGGVKAAMAHHQVLMTPNNEGLYFDHYQGDPQAEAQECYRGYNTLEKVYKYNPVSQQIAEAGVSEFVLGVQGNIWGEFVHNDAEVEWRAWPRSLALAEMSWTPLERKDYQDFLRRCDGPATENLMRHGVNFHIPSVEQPGGSCDYLAFFDQRDLTLKATRPLNIRYTLDGTDPDADSPLYTAPLHLTKTTAVKTCVELPAGILGPVRTITATKVKGYQPASKPGKIEKGFTCKIFNGSYRSVAALQDTPDKVVVIDSLLQIRNRAKMPRDMRNAPHYSAIAEGYFDVPADGIYEFHTMNSQLWIDGRLVIDNSDSLLQRHSRKNVEIALQKGLHEIKVVFLGGVFRIISSYEKDTSVSYRAPGQKWHNISAAESFH